MPRYNEVGNANLNSIMSSIYIQQLIFLRLASVVLVRGPVNQVHIFAHIWSVSGIVCATARPLLATVSRGSQNPAGLTVNYTVWYFR